ncbi:DHA2 family efflux MFS transporter permease subunit [Novosphingobium sp. JCM 18896]|uniref:DHA2 family efflux MFS transporter permease subunit n=1 Tax=Novosphingobium sp. JCM 18896 TaxID=2989731 RepID=UPI0022213B59|nr:DHA2 family efflux MFS transporter permease subunit [Novosphingobium sp. JCM 18896]MCW1430316.1 DHA2 family efflux MFS transporter permease subunit [Novosphingobium sp. JCM 18896]
MNQTYPPALRRNLITLFALSGAFMTQLDATIANVALPHMQASTSASREQVTWVLTSYIVMAATFTPLSGWLAGRIGRKRVFLGSIAGFTIASVLCGAAVNLDQLIAFRLLQGIMGASLLPMSQAILLDINPPEKHGSAMAIWGMGAILGPIVGPLAGGWLTDNFSWRWIFFINVPVGIAAFVGLVGILDETRDKVAKQLDLAGFALLGLAVASFQLMLDRGQLLDWFASTEIWIEATIAAGALYLFVVHSLTTARPFVDLSMFKDRNYVIGNLLGFFLGGLMYGVIALTAPMLAELMNYPIELVGLVTAPRGIGTLIAMPIAGRLSGKVDARIMLFIGLAFCGWSMALLSGASLEMDSELVIVSGVIQGFGAGLMFVPITITVFATLAPRLRNEGAAFNSLIRNLGAAVWISALQILTIRNEATVHSRLVETVRPDSPAMALRAPEFDFGVTESIAMLDREISRQALMVSYIDSFWLIFLACLVVAPLVVMLKKPRQG